MISSLNPSSHHNQSISLDIHVCIHVHINVCCTLPWQIRNLSCSPGEGMAEAMGSIYTPTKCILPMVPTSGAVARKDARIKRNFGG